MKELKYLGIEWDLVYLGRKKLKYSDEPWVRIFILLLIHSLYFYFLEVKDSFQIFISISKLTFYLFFRLKDQKCWFM